MSIAVEMRIYRWLGFWREKLPPDAIVELQNILGPIAIIATTEPPDRLSIIKERRINQRGAIRELLDDMDYLIQRLDDTTHAPERTTADE